MSNQLKIQDTLLEALAHGFNQNNLLYPWSPEHLSLQVRLKGVASDTAHQCYCLNIIRDFWPALARLYGYHPGVAEIWGPPVLGTPTPYH